jgi:hypothetical protein
MFLNERDEIGRSVTRERRLRKVRIGRDEVFGLAMKIREITASPTGDEDLFANAFGKIDKGNSPAPFTGFDRANQSGGAGSQDYDVEFVFQGAP